MTSSRASSSAYRWNAKYNMIVMNLSSHSESQATTELPSLPTTQSVHLSGGDDLGTF